MEDPVFYTFISVILLIPAILVILLLSINHWLQSSAKKILTSSIGEGNLYFTKHSFHLSKIYFDKNPSGKWSLLTCYSFSCQKEGKKISGSALISNTTLVDIKFYS